MPETAHRSVECELEAFERLTIELSSRFGYLTADEIPDAIEDALHRIVETLGVDRSTVFELSDRHGEGFLAMHFWARPGIPPLARRDAESVLWYFDRLRNGHVIRVEDVERDVPPDATAERSYARRAGMQSNLTIPVSIAGGLVCALALGAFRQPRKWPDPLVERARLIAQIIASALQRRRQELALRSAMAEVELLNRKLEAENLYLREEIRSSSGFDEIVGDSGALLQVLEQIEQVAPLDTTVLIVGETGTGKELVARAIHERSSRKKRALVRVNCAALPAGLIESEFFGHEKGAFTGAAAQRQGRFEIADGGSLLLDEVGDFPLELQGRLLRVLQDGEFERVGSSRTQRVDVRLIAATNRDLPAMVRAGAFRSDLYYRLSVFPIALPPLRERADDIPQLVWRFVEQKNRQLGRRIERIPRETMDALRCYDWPGNVRELQNVVERAMVRSLGDVLEMHETLTGSGAARASATESRALADVERRHVEAVLGQCEWRINGPGGAAEKLGLHPNTLRFRMKKLGISRPRRREGSKSERAGRRASGGAPSGSSPGSRTLSAPGAGETGAGRSR